MGGITMKNKVVCKKFAEGLYQYSVWCPDYIEGADKIQRVLNSRKAGEAISVQERKAAMLQINSLANGLAFCWVVNNVPDRKKVGVENDEPDRKKVVKEAVIKARGEFPNGSLHLIDKIKVLMKACIKLSEKKVNLDYIGYQSMDAIYALVIAYQNIIQVDVETMELVKQYFTGISVGRTILMVSKEQYDIEDEFDL